MAEITFNGYTPSAISPVSNALLVFKISPNPANNVVTINTDETLLGGKLTVTDITGRIITETQIVEPTSTLSASAFASGVYFIRVNKGGVNEVRKLVVSR
jgi:hypothetical protein